MIGDGSGLNLATKTLGWTHNVLRVFGGLVTEPFQLRRRGAENIKPSIQPANKFARAALKQRGPIHLRGCSSFALLWKPDAPQQVLKSQVGAQAVQAWIDLQVKQPLISSLICAL